MQFLIGFASRFFGKLFTGVGGFLFGFLSPLVAPVVGGVARFLSKRAIYLAMFASIAGFIVTFIAVMTVLAKSVMHFVPPEYVSVARMFVPDNLAACIAVVAAAKFHQIVILWKIKIVETMAAAK